MRSGRPDRHETSRTGRLARLWLVAAITAAALAAVAAHPAVAATTPSWPKTRFDAANTAFNPSETSISRANVATLAEDWATTTSRSASAVVAGGVIYTGCDSGGFCALDARDGSVRWTTPLWGVVPPGAEVLVGNTVFVGVNRPPTEYALDATTGAVLWKTLVTNGPGSDFGTPPIAADGLVFQAVGGFVFAWDAATGIQRWVVRLGVQGIMAVAGGVLYAEANPDLPALYALRASTGQTLWQSAPALGAARAPVVAGGLVIAGTSTGGVVLPGQMAAYPAGGCGAAVCSPVWVHEWASGDAAVAGNVVYQGFTDGTFAALDLATGRVLWRAATTGNGGPTAPRPVSATVANGLLFGAGDRGTYAWDAAGCGAEVCLPLWQGPVGPWGYFYSDVLVVDGRLYVQEQAGVLHAYSPRVNRSPGTAPPPVVPPPPPPPPPPPAGPLTIRVPGDQLSIQRAIDSSHTGDVVVVAPGTYHERLDFHGHSVEVRSSGGPQVTTIDGDGVSAVVMFQTNETRASTLRGFTIRGGYFESDGGGVAVQRASPTIVGNVITGNHAVVGSGISVIYSDGPLILDNTVSDNHSVGYGASGGGVSITGTRGAEVRGNLIENNSVDYYGGGLVIGGPATVADNIITANTAGVRGGGVQVGSSNGDVVFTQNVITGNTASSGGGLLWAGTASSGVGLPLVANTIAANVAITGSAMTLFGHATLVDNLLTGPPGTSVVECDNTYRETMLSLSHNDIYSGDASPAAGCGPDVAGGPGELAADPLFVNPAARDFRLGAGSPAVDVGDNAAPGLPATDVTAAARIVDGNGDGTATVDLGAYEVQHVPLVAAGSPFHALAPARVLDTRNGTGGITGPIGPGTTVALTVAGVGGVPATGVSAVVLNVTVDAPSATSFLTAWPAGLPRPLASNLNFVAGQTVPNLVVVEVGDGGRVSFYNNAGSTQVVADVAGWFGVDGTGGGAGYTALTPARVLDTRVGVGAPAAKVGAASTVGLQVAGVGGVPATGVSAVVLNVTVTEPTATSFLTAWPAGQAQPLASNLNFLAGQTVPNLVVVKVGVGGKVNLYNNAGATHVVADVEGWFGADGAPGGSGFTSLAPVRVLDTRTGNGAVAAKVGPGSTLNLQVTGRGGVPATGVSAVVLNITVTEPTAASFLTAWPAGQAQPLASNLNFLAGQTVPNLVVVKVGSGGRVNLYGNVGSTHVVADVAGWFSG